MHRFIFVLNISLNKFAYIQKCFYKYWIFFYYINYFFNLRFFQIVNTLIRNNKEKKLLLYLNIDKKIYNTPYVNLIIFF